MGNKSQELINLLEDYKLEENFDINQYFDFGSLNSLIEITTHDFYGKIMFFLSLYVHFDFKECYKNKIFLNLKYIFLFY